MTEHVELLLPREIESLDELAPDLHEFYEENETHDGFVLSAVARAECEKGEAKIAAAYDEIAKLKAESASLDRQITRIIIDRELTAALRGKVKTELMSAARALLAQTKGITVKRDGDNATAIVVVEGERVAFGDYIASWLASDQAKAFLVPLPLTIGPYETALRLVTDNTLH